MNAPLRHIVYFLGLLALGLVITPLAVHAEVAIIANKDVPADSLSKDQLRDIYTYDVRQWSNMLPVVVLDLTQKSTIRNAFYNYLGKPASRMKSIWLKKLLMGEGNPPEVVSDEQAMIARVAEVPGAIGFADASHISDSVKVLAIIPSEK